jgi:GalNAc-alpha-(1->4)-GalNAc-alpha-(1->3)-diNAcBac-PP-undecaprenol alpha-1,4-N-acetyl-D-galactosaminyltransferase
MATEERPKILLVISSLSCGGAERVVTLIANELIKDFEVRVLCIRDAKPFYTIKDSITVDSLSYYPRGIFKIPLVGNIILVFRIMSYIRCFKPSIIIAFMITTAISTWIATLPFGIPVVFASRNNPIRYSTQLDMIRKILLPYFYAGLSGCVLQTKQGRDFVAAHYSPTKTFVIPNPAPVVLPSPRSPERQKTILAVGRLVPQKGFENLLSAFAAAKPTDWTLKIIGQGPLGPQLKQKCQELEIHRRVSFLPPTPDIYDHYLTASIFILSSIYEGFPNVLLEAMAHGLPCISTNCPTGPSEIISHNVNGVLVPITSTSKLSEELTRLMNNSDLRLSLGKIAQESLNRFEKSQIIQSWKNCIEEILCVE